MRLPTLYKRTSTGKIQQWIIEVDRDKYRTISGQIDGVQVESAWTKAKPKNLGRANETTAKEQAISEAQSKWNKKLQIDYHEDISTIDTPKIYQPMLAHTWEKHKHKMPDKVLYSPKLDGIRVIITKDGCHSRQGKPFPALSFFSRLLRPVFDLYPDAILDGEAYNHSLKDNFNKIISLCRQTKEKKIEEMRDEIEANIYPVLFDAPRIGQLSENNTFKDRWELLEATGVGARFLIPFTYGVKSDLENIHSKYISDGYEGTMIRDPLGSYENKRSYTLLKHKDFIDDEFRIVDIEEGIGNRSGMMGRVHLEMSDGRTFEANARGGQELYIDMWKNQQKYIGKSVTVRYQNLTPDGIPRFGVIVGLRDYE